MAIRRFQIFELRVLFACIAIAMVSTGCNRSSSSPTVAEAEVSRGEEDPNYQPPSPPAESDDTGVLAGFEVASPEGAVKTFLDSLRSGDEARARALLTARARQETSRKGLVVQPPGSPQATYEIVGVKYVSSQKDRAEVASVWTEPTPTGTRSDRITWVLRRTLEGWRVSGMAMELVPGQPPQLLNFEDPDDMEHQLQVAEEQLANRQESVARQTDRNLPEAPVTR